MFGHEKFEAYQLAIKFLKIALELTERLPSGNAALRDQFKRAAMSVVLNIAEGSGRLCEPDRRRFYSIARGSAMESAAICDVIALLDERFQAETSEAKTLLKSVVSILTTVCSK